MTMENETVIGLAEGLGLLEKTEEQKEPKIWISNDSTIAILSTDSKIQNLLEQYEDIKKDEANDMTESIKKLEWETTVLISSSHLKLLLEFLKKNKDIDTVKIYAKKDYPFKVELKSIGTSIIIAPRIED